MKKNWTEDDKVIIIILTVVITGITFYFSIPHFMDIEKIRHLSSRIENFHWNDPNPNNSSFPNNNGNNNQNFWGSTDENGNQNSEGNTNNPQLDNENNSNPSNNNNENNSGTNAENNNGNVGSSSNPENQSNNNNSNQNNGNNNNNNNPTGNTPTPPENVEKPEEHNPEPPQIEETPKEENGEKTFTVAFYQNGASEIGANKLECTTKTDRCTITLPNIIRNEGTVYGWSSENGTTATYAPNSSFTVTKNQYLYAITSRTYQMTYIANGANISRSSDTCTAYNVNHCTITTPSITRSNGQGLGFSTNKNAMNGEYNGTFTPYQNMTLYAISYTNHTASFHPNGAYQIETSSKTCQAYNTNTACSISMPNITDRDAYTIFGWTTSIQSESISHSENEIISLSSDKTYYALRKISDQRLLINEAYQGLSLVNNLRKTMNLSPLSWSTSLAFSAQLRATEIISDPKNYNANHTRPDNREFYTVNNFAYGENLTQTYTTNPQDMYQNFFNSAPHKAQMLDKDYTKIGIAAIKNPTDNLYYWVQLFGE